MPREPTGTVYATRNGYGIRWPEDGRKYRRVGFATKTEARRWYAETVAPRLGHRRPSPEITFDAFCDAFLKRHGATVAPATKRTLEERLAPARDVFGEWTLRELEGAADDVAAWRAGLGEGARYRLTSAFRQALSAAVRWGYIVRNPAADAGKNPQPRAEELLPFTAAEVDKLAVELGPVFGPLAVFAAETGLRTNEWAALQRRDLDRAGRAVTVQRRYADGVFTPYPKTKRSRRRVPLTARAWGGRGPAAAARYAAPLSGVRGRADRPRHLADPRVVSRRGRRRDRETGPLPPAAYLRDGGPGGGRLDL